MKFGGTSMGSADTIKNHVAQIIKEKSKTEKGIVVVVSAMGGVTNVLLEAADLAIKRDRKGMHKKVESVRAKHQTAAKEMIKNPDHYNNAINYIDEKLDGLEYFLEAISTIGELTPRSHDVVLAIGEKLSAMLLSCVLKDQNMTSTYVNMDKIIPSDLSYETHAYWDEVAKLFKKRLSEEFSSHVIPVVTGFFGPNPGGIICAVGRGYSDFCAALCGETMKAKVIEIWTDVDGILSTDPRLVPEAKILKQVSFNEAAELSHFGAKVLHPQSIRPAINANIPIHILNTFNPKAKGTIIATESKKSGRPFKAIAYKKDITVIRIHSYRMLLAYGFMAKIFDIFAKHKVAIDLIATSEVSVSLTVEESSRHLKKLITDLETLGRVVVDSNKSIIAIVGEEMQSENYIKGKIFDTFSANRIKVEMSSIGNSLINVSVVVDNSKVEKAVKLLHKKFF